MFAQAKAAVKRVACLSNVKQLNTGAILYQSDHEDADPLSTPFVDGAWNAGSCNDLPWDWEPGLDEKWYESAQTTGGNSVQPYVKSLDLMQSPVQKVQRLEGCLQVDPSKALTKYYSANYAMNGLLEGMAATAVAQPARLIAFHQPLGRTSILGEFISDPSLEVVVRRLLLPRPAVPPRLRLPGLGQPGRGILSGAPPDPS